MDLFFPVKEIAMEGTRNTIIKAFKLLLDEKPMTKITVKDVVEQCGINRNTFYYHFQDIPTLFQKMMEEKAEELIENHYQPDEPIECIRPFIQYGVRNRRAILHVYRYVPRETFLYLLESDCFPLYAGILCQCSRRLLDTCQQNTGFGAFL